MYAIIYIIGYKRQASCVLCVLADLNIDLQVSNDVGHVMSQVPQGQSSCMQGQVPGPPCLPPHNSPTALKISLNALQPQQILENNIVLDHDLQNEAISY